MLLPDLLQLLEDVGKELARRGMAAQVERARQLFAALRAAQRAEWDEAAVIEWASMLRVPPFHERYPVRSRSAECLRPRGGEAHQKYTRMNFPGGFLAACSCGERWLVVDE